MIKKIKIEDIPGLRKPREGVISQIEEFYKSDWPACEVESHGYKTANSARNAWRKAVESTHLGITVITRADRVFMIRNKEVTE